MGWEGMMVEMMVGMASGGRMRGKKR